jgi:hypothetical protein
VTRIETEATTPGSVQSAFEAAGVEFIAENGGGAGVYDASSPDENPNRVKSRQAKAGASRQDGAAGLTPAIVSRNGIPRSRLVRITRLVRL